MLYPPLSNQVWSFVSPKGALTSNEDNASEKSMDILDKPFSRQIDLQASTGHNRHTITSMMTVVEFHNEAGEIQ